MFSSFNGSKRPLTAIVFSLLILLFASVAYANHITINGTFTDWASEASFVDPGGVDDETSPARSDITEFRSSAEASGIYMLMAWDNTSFNGGNATTAGITFLGANGTYYRIYTTAAGNPGSIDLTTLDINSCSDSTCSSQTAICVGAACTGATVGSSTNWTDPFIGAGHTSSNCTGTNCETKDTAVEMFIPWTLIGGAPTNGQRTFSQFASYPSGPGQGEKDGTGPNGISCLNTNGTMNCYPSTPTAITMKQLVASSAMATSLSIGTLLSFAAIGLLMLTTLFLVRRRA